MANENKQVQQAQQETKATASEPSVSDRVKVLESNSATLAAVLVEVLSVLERAAKVNGVTRAYEEQIKAAQDKLSTVK